MGSVTLEEAAKALEELRISSSSAQSITKDSRRVEIPELAGVVFSDPVFSGFLIDASGSMAPYSQAVIDGQFDMIQVLRGSDKCKKGALYVIQYLFSDKVEPLHEFLKLSPTGMDNVKLLKSGNYYTPRSTTALYHSIFYLLQDMAANIANAYNSGLKSTFTIGVITDGVDTEGGVQPSEIKKLIQELQSNGILRSSVIVGLINPDFTKEMLEELRSLLGFQQAISLSQNPSEIRQAFILASQSSISGQKQ